MDTLDFLKRVLPDEGLYVGAVLNNKKFTHVYTESVEELSRKLHKLDARGKNVFYAVSSFNSERRNQKNVNKTKVFALDIDCGEGKPYPNQKRGVKALKKFLGVSGLPTPMIVSSGNGLHCYWVLDKAISPDEWKPVALHIKKSALDFGLEIDPTVTGDSARVLRPLGTTNPKGGKQVTLLVDRPNIKLSALGIPSVSNSTKNSTHTPASSKLAIALKTESDFPPALRHIVQSKCQQVNWAVANPEDVTEPFWYSLMGVAAYCHDPEETAKEWSSGHDGYDPAAAVAKMYQWKNSTDGPATCSRFANERPKGCQGCPFSGKINTPARLGAQYVEVEVDDKAPDREASSIPIPKPFKRTGSGIKVTIEDTDIDVCPFDIYPVSYGKDENLGYEVVRYHWKRPHVGWQELVFRQALLTDGSRDFPVTIADQGIVLNGKRQTEYFQLMLRGYMDELRKKRSLTNLYSSMGWKNNKREFVIGNTLIRRKDDGSVVTQSITLDSTGSDKTVDMYSTSGTLEKWVNFTKILDKADMHPHMFALGIGFSSVFYAFTGLKGITISFKGESGAGKSVAQLWLQSIYGDPNALHMSSKFTQNSLFNRMGTYCHLPMTIDEVSLMSEKDAADLVYWVTQGRDKIRLSRTSQERDSKEWSMPTLVSTNQAMTGKLISAGLDSEAQMLRLLEFDLETHRAFAKGSSAGRKIYEFLGNNYGTAGREYIKKLLELGPEAIQAMVSESSAVLANDFGTEFHGQERFWEQAMSLTYLSLKLAKEWELIEFDPRKPVQWALEYIGAIRKEVADSKSDSFDMLAEFINENANASVVVMHTGNQTMVDHNRLPRGELRLRFDLYRPTAKSQFDKGTMTIHRAFLRKWLAVNGFDYNTFMKELTAANVVVSTNGQRAYLSKDTPLKVGQTYVVVMNLSHGRLRGILDKAEEDGSDLTLGDIKLVKS